MKITVFVFAGACLAIAGSAYGQHAYAVDNNENLYSVNLASGNASLIGNTGFFLEGLALSPGDQLYGTDSSGNLVSVNTSTGAGTLVGNTGLGDIEGLDFAGGNLWGTAFDAPTSLHLIDQSTGVAGFAIPSNNTDGVARAMAFDPTFTFAYTLNDGANGGQDLWATQSSGTSTFVGSWSMVTGAPLPFTAAMDFDNSTGDLWALGSGGEVMKVNAGTGEGAVVGSTGSQFWLDMTMNPVPEPASMAALGLGVAAVLRRRRK